MLDIKFVKANPELVKADLRKRNDLEKLPWVDELIGKNERYWKLKSEADQFRNRRNVITREINELRKAGRDFQGKVLEAKELPEKIRADDRELEELQARIRFILARLPNLLHESVPVGADESGNKEIRRWGKPKKVNYQLRVHGELLEERNLADFRRAAKVSGSGFVFLKNELVLLEIALVRFAVDLLRKKGFQIVQPPLMLGKKHYEAVTALSDFEDVMYKIEGENSYLIATSEHPMAAMYADEAFEESELPVKLCGISACFRKEIGSHGVDSRGLFRMHQFNKVEQFVFCRPGDSWKLHEELLKNAEELFRKLKIPYRVISICTGDIGIVAAKKYDIEAWFPREESYKEVVSCSNCTSYQAVGLNIKVKKGSEEKEFVHTLNCTEVATSRALRAIVENYQDKDGSVRVPAVLVPYMGGVRVIGKKAAG